MKYCSHCGNEVLDEAVICPKCGCPIQTVNIAPSSAETEEKEVEKIIDEMERQVSVLWLLAIVGFFICPILIVGLVKILNVRVYKKKIADPALAESYANVRKKLDKLITVYGVLISLWIVSIILIVSVSNGLI